MCIALAILAHCLQRKEVNYQINIQIKITTFNFLQCLQCVCSMQDPKSSVDAFVHIVKVYRMHKHKLNRWNYFHLFFFNFNSFVRMNKRSLLVSNNLSDFRTILHSTHIWTGKSGRVNSEFYRENFQRLIKFFSNIMIPNDCSMPFQLPQNHHYSYNELESQLSVGMQRK